MALNQEPVLDQQELGLDLVLDPVQLELSQVSVLPLVLVKLKLARMVKLRPGLANL